MRALTLLFIISLTNLSHLQAQEQDFKKPASKYFKNLYQINDSIYRSEQPSKKGFHAIEDMGVKTVISFRRHREDYRKTRNTQLQLVQVPLKAEELTEADLLHTLKVIQAVEKPVLIHCWHGSDRTGVVSAAYRVVFEDWSKERAIKELRYTLFSYNENLYPNLVDLIEDLDAKQLRKELGIN